VFAFLFIYLFILFFYGLLPI